VIRQSRSRYVQDVGYLCPDNALRPVAKAAAEFVQLVEIPGGDADFTALAAGMVNRDSCPERESEFVRSARASASTVAVALREDEGPKCRLGCVARRAEADARRPEPAGLRAEHAVTDRAAPRNADAPGVARAADVSVIPMVEAEASGIGAAARS